MRIESMMIRRVRSLENVELRNCRSFNVLIGRNNSGKSNILSAVSAFFECIAAGAPVTLRPPLREPIDFYKQDISQAIEITLTFIMAPAEIEVLRDEIVREAPQVRNAAAELGSFSHLLAALEIGVQGGTGFAFIRKLALEYSQPLNGGEHTERPILLLNPETAAELRSNLFRARESMADAEAMARVLERIDEDDWSRFRREGREASHMLRFLVDRPISRDAVRTIEGALGESQSYQEFRGAMRSLASTKRDEAEAARGASLKNKVGTFAGEQESIPNYVSQLLTRLSDMKVLYLKERRQEIGREEAKRLLDLKNQREGTKRFQSIQQVVETLLGVQLGVFYGAANTRAGDRIAEIDIGDLLLEVNGAGIREALRIVLDVEFENPVVLLVEEPEICLHPALEASMMRYLKQLAGTCQVFLSTHSTNFLDRAEATNVYLVSKPDSTKVQSVDLEEAETQILSELGVRLSSVFMFDRLVLVEGGSDEAVMREWAAILNVNLNAVNAGFIHMEGARNFAHFAAESTLSFLTKRRVRIWFVIDRDEKDEPQINILRERLGELASLSVLARREIENYLLYPRAIAEFIKWKRNAGGEKLSAANEASEMEVAKALEECAEELKELTLEKRVARLLCKPMYVSEKRLFDIGEGKRGEERFVEELTGMIASLSDTKGRVADVFKEQSDILGNEWNSAKLSLVPGDLLLDATCKRFGVRFKKDHDAARIAALMKPDEIAADMRRLIMEIGKEAA